MPGPEHFTLAPMSRPFKAMTWIFLAVTPAFALFLHQPPSAGYLLSASFAAVILLIWLYFKPSRFEAGPEGLAILWPLRRRRIPRAEIASFERLNARDLGWMLRIGAGGLWGAFGMFWTSREGLIDGYFSTTENLILLRLKSRRPLLLSPERPDDFVKALGL